MKLVSAQALKGCEVIMEEKKKMGRGRRPHLDGETPSGKIDQHRQTECVNKASVGNNGREQQIEACVCVSETRQ